MERMSKRGPYRWPIGIELTGINPATRRYSYNEKNDAAYSIQTHLESNHIPHFDCGFDDHCLEIPTNKLWSWSETVEQVKSIRKVLMKFGYTPKGVTTVCGGSHVHVGATNRNLKIAIYKDCIMRPYLPWVFGEIDESGAMDVIINRKKEVVAAAEFVRYHRYNPDDANTDLGFCPSSHIALFMLQYTNTDDPTPVWQYSISSELNGKNDMVEFSNRHGTIEFRFFEMAPSWDEQVLQLEFLFAYLNWVSDRFERGDVTDVYYITPKELQEITAKQAADSFLELCDQIDIDGANYKHLLKRNLYPRWSEGYTRR